jgi:hypothetical protein
MKFWRPRPAKPVALAAALTASEADETDWID